METESSQAVDRIFSVIETIAEESTAIGITDISKKVGLPKSTVYRIVSSLVLKNYLIKDDNDHYKLGYKFIAVAGDYVAKLDIRTAAAPYIHNLSMSLNVTAHVAIRQGESAIYIEKIHPYSHICMYSEIGKSIDLYCSALGKSLLLGFSNEEFHTYINSVKTVKYTSNSLDRKQLEKEIGEARKSLLTYDNEEHELNVYCIATPIIDYSGKVIAAISISSGEPLILSDLKYRNALLSTGLTISKLFGKK